MDGNGSINYRNWGFYEPPAALRGHLGLQLMSGGHEKPLSGGRPHPTMMNNNNNIGSFHHMLTSNGPFHHRIGGLSESSMPIDFARGSWLNQHNHSSFSLLPESSGGQEIHMMQPHDSPTEEEGLTQLDEIEMGPAKKRPGGKNQKSPKAKKPKKAPKQSVELVINGVDMDISNIPIPICSCTGTPRQCYRWGSGGWQSACCTTGISVYPLPISTKKRGARISGRKMSIGAFKKVLEKLASEGYDFSHPIDLRTHWAKHGTNKFVTIR